MSYVAPIETRTLTARDFADRVINRTTPFGEFLGANVAEGFWASAPGQAGAFIDLPLPGVTEAEIQHRSRLFRESPEAIRADAARAGMIPMTQERWKASPWFREGVAFDDAMTPGRAAAIADVYDANAYRRWLIEQRDAGVFDMTAGFVAQMVGSAPDPINYIPVFGPGARAFAVARATRVLGPLGSQVAGRAAVSASEAALTTAAAEPFLIAGRARFGDEVTFADAVLDVAVGAAIGAAFGGASGAFARRVELRRATSLRGSQGALNALNEAVHGVVIGQPIDVGRMREARDLGRAYDRVRAVPQGPADDPLVRITPQDIDETIIARGGYQGIGDATVKGSGFGLVKFIWRHGEESGKAPAAQVDRGDVVAFPEIIRDFEPTRAADPTTGQGREWRVERNGRVLVYGESRLSRDNRDHIVSIYVQEPGRPGAGDPLSVRRTGSPRGAVGGPPGDTAAGAFDRASQSQAGVPAPRNIGERARAVDRAPTDQTVAAPDDPVISPAELAALERDDIAIEHGVDPETGDFFEAAQLAELEAAGRITGEERAEIDAAEIEWQKAQKAEEAYDAAASCVLRGG